MWQTNDFSSDLWYAAAWSDLESVQNILDGGNCNINCRKPNNGNTPLYIASAWGFQKKVAYFYYFEIVQLLIDYGADVDIPNNLGRTPLYIASSWSHNNIVPLLIRGGADLNAPNIDGRTPLHIAAISARYGHYRRSYKYHASQLAVDFMERVRTTGEFLEFLTDLEEDYQFLMSNLPSYMDGDISDEIMDIVLFYNHFATVTELVEAGAELNIMDDRQETPLTKAAYCGHLPMMQYLISNGADINVVNCWGRCIAGIAARRGHSHVVEYLNQIQ